MRETAHPHDAYFKLLGASPAVAADIIRPLLDPAVAAAIDWSTLELAPNEITEQDGETHRADLVYKARFNDREAYILALAEHQSTPDPMMPWRVLVYMVGIWRYWLEHHPDAKTLPPIIPIIIYNGRHPWRAPLDFAALFADTPVAVLDALRPYLPTFRLLIDDLAATPEEQIEADHHLALAIIGLMTLKHGHTDDPDEAYIRLAPHIPAALAHPGARALLATTADYLYRNSDARPNIDEIHRRTNPEAEEIIMTYRQQLLAEGHEQGRRGASAEMLCEALVHRFGELPASVAARVEAATATELRYWFSRQFVAEALDDVFAPADGAGDAVSRSS